MKSAHGNQHNEQEAPLASGPIIMQYPFTCIVAVCTQTGKTVWINNLLENAKTTINPLPERIVWYYGQWQPMHFEMVNTIPGIEYSPRN
jgi:hypothetical protein